MDDAETRIRRARDLIGGALMLEDRQARDWLFDYVFRQVFEDVDDLRDALDRERAAHGVTRAALAVLLDCLDADDSHPSDSMKRWCDTCKAITAARAALAATEGEGAL